MKDLESAAREIIRLGESRTAMDQFVFAAYTANHAVELAKSWLEMRNLLLAVAKSQPASWMTDEIHRVLGGQG